MTSLDMIHSIPVPENRLTVSLLMPVLNESDNVARTLDAVFASSRLPDEIVIADGGSTDDTLSRLNAYQQRGVLIVITDNPQVYAGAGRNAAARLAGGDVLLCLDFGNEPEADWIAEIMRIFEASPTVQAVGSPYRPIINNDFEFCVAALQYGESLRWCGLSPEQLLKQAGGNIHLGGLGTAVRRELWRELGGMPEWLRAAEDYLFGEKVKLLGLVVNAAPKAWLRHHMRSTAMAVFRQNFTYARGLARIGKMPKLLRRLSVMLLALLAVLWALKSIVGSVAILAGYILLGAFRPLARVDGGLKKAGHFFHAPRILLAKEAGTLAGWLSGTFDWHGSRYWRDQCNNYLARRSLS